MRILFAGDSNTSGPNLPPEQYYPAIVETLCDDVESVNLGVPGSKLGAWVPWAGQLWSTLIQPQMPADALVIMLGSNDNTTSPPPTPVPEYIGGIYGICEKFGGHVFVITPPVAFAPSFSLALYAWWCRAIAAAHPRASLAADPYRMIPATDYLDLAHLNADAQRRLGMAVATSIVAHRGY